MGSTFKTVTGISLGGLFVLFSLHGNEFFRSVENAFNFLYAISAKAPLGVGSFVMSLFAATLLWLAMQKWIAETRNRWSRSWLIDLLTALGGAYVAYMQLPTSNGILFGVMAGLCAPHAARIAMAISTYISHRIDDKLDELDVRPSTPPSVMPQKEGDPK
jgi:predicted membrane protein